MLESPYTNVTLIRIAVYTMRCIIITNNFTTHKASLDFLFESIKVKHFTI